MRGMLRRWFGLCWRRAPGRRVRVTGEIFLILAVAPCDPPVLKKSKRKRFFFEKKKQKTFIHCRRYGVRTGELRAILNGRGFFGSFLQKRTTDYSCLAMNYDQPCAGEREYG